MIQRTFFFGALAVNLSVVVRVGFVVDGGAAAQNEHAVHQPVLSAGDIRVERGELLRINGKLFRCCLRPIFGIAGLLRDRGDGEQA